MITTIFQSWMGEWVADPRSQGCKINLFVDNFKGTNLLSYNRYTFDLNTLDQIFKLSRLYIAICLSYVLLIDLLLKILTSHPFSRLINWLPYILQKQAWISIKESTITNYWRYMKILPPVDVPILQDLPNKEKEIVIDFVMFYKSNF